MPLIPDGRARAAGFRLGGERRDGREGERERGRGRSDAVAATAEVQIEMDRDTAEFTRHHVSGKDTAVHLMLPLSLSRPDDHRR